MSEIIPFERIVNKIYLIRNTRVMLDRDLAELYGVENKVLNQSVKRNIKRFPRDFMFQLTKKEFENWKSQIVTSNSDKMGLRKMPYVFTEHGILMLSSILNSDRAIKINIQIMRVFSQLRQMFSSHEELKRKIEDIEKQYDKKFDIIDKQFKIVFEAFEEIKQLFSEEQESIREIGFKHDNDKQQ